MDRVGSRRAFIRNVVLFGCAIESLASWAGRARSPRMHRIGFLIGSDYAPLIAAFKEELRGLGYVEGENVTIELRLSRANISHVPTQAVELA